MRIKNEELRMKNAGGRRPFQFQNSGVTLLPGQTIMEMLLVFLIISMGLYGAVTLILSNVTHKEFDADNIVAMNMAREQLELAQNRRDANWLGDKAFDDGMLNIAGGCTAISNWNGTAVPAFVYAASAQPVRLSNLAVSLGMFTNQAGTATDFSRWITFAPICAKPDHSATAVSATCTCSDPTYTDKVGMRVLSNVQWTRRGSGKSLSIYTDLYDWR